MCKHTQKIAIISALIAVVAGIPTLFARDAQDPSVSMMERGTTGHGRTMMGQTSQMMDSCANMMQGRGNDGGRPNDRWRKPAPSNPDKNG